MDKELINILLDTLEKYNSRLGKAEAKTTQINTDMSKISKELPTSIKSAIAAEMAKVPKADNADYSLLKRLLEEDIKEYLITHNMTVKNLKSELEAYITNMKSEMIGPEGKEGRPGKDGKAGVDGKDGKTGSQGKQGPIGKPGKDGSNGKDGKDGVSSKIDDVSFKDGVLCFTIDSKKFEVTLPIPQGYAGGGSSKVATKLGDLKDASISRPSTGQYLSWDGNKWVAVDAPSTTTSNSNSLQFLDIDGTADIEAYAAIITANITVTIPDATNNVGSVLNIKSIHVDGCTVVSSDGIDADSNLELVQYENLKIVSDGTQWYVI